MKTNELLSRFKWKPIRNCPGRYTLDFSDTGRFNAFFHTIEEIREFSSPAVEDAVLIVFLDDGGLISYRHQDGFIVHTLSEKNGFERKMKVLLPENLSLSSFRNSES